MTPRTSARLRALVPLAVVGLLVSLPAWAAVVDVSAGNFYFDVDGDQQTDTIRAEVGDQLRVVVQDSGPGTPHTVEVDELGIHSGPLRAGESFTTPPLQQAGTFRLYCDPHENRGHTTTLVVAGESTSSPSPSPAPSDPTSEPSPTATAEPPPPADPTSEPSPRATSEPSPTQDPTPGPTTGDPTPSEGTSPTPGTEEVPDPSPPPSATPASTPGEDGPGGDDETLAPVGRGTADPAELDASAAPGSLDDILGRAPRDDAPWTRAVWLAFGALLPLTAIAGAVLVAARRRHDIDRGPAADGEDADGDPADR